MTCFIYVMEQVDIGIIKIGISQDPDARTAALSYATGLRMTLIYSKEYESKDDSYLVEQHAHKEFNEWQVSGEWFKDVDIDQVLDFIEAVDVAALKMKTKPKPKLKSKPRPKPLRGSSATKQFIQFKAPEHMWQFLAESAEEGCTSMSTIIRNLIFDKKKKKESMDKAA